MSDKEKLSKVLKELNNNNHCIAAKVLSFLLEMGNDKHIYSNLNPDKVIINRITKKDSCTSQDVKNALKYLLSNKYIFMYTHAYSSPHFTEYGMTSLCFPDK